MNKRTLRFLDVNLGKRLKPLRDAGDAKANAARAATFGVSEEVWVSLTAELRARKVEKAMGSSECSGQFESAILMGFAIGWYEATHQTDKSKEGGVKSCPKGAIVNKEELAELASIVDIAIDSNQVLLDSNMPPESVPRKAWSRQDKELFSEWTGQIRRWRKLRASLEKEAA